MLTLDGNTLEWSQVITVARGSETVQLAGAARVRMASSRQVIEDHLAAGDVVYGVTTGFGKFAQVAIPPDKRFELQRNLVRSHAAGVGDPFATDVVRGMLLLRANALAKGASGVRPVLVETLLQMLNARVHPIIPKIGSLGASGDLAPLAHLALVLIGEGEAEYQHTRMAGGQAMQLAGIPPLELQAKEGLALLNGTQGMSAIAALLRQDAGELCKLADIAGALSIDGTLSSYVPCDPALHELRPHPGAQAAARNVRRLLANSEIMRSHADCRRVQDPYSLRCLPQVHGAARDALTHLEAMLAIEINSATDNPLVLPDGRVVSGGNFHGQPIALRLDYLKLALHELGSISERRVDWIMNPNLTDLPAFLAPQEGLHSGYMIAQYTSAALVNQNHSLCSAASAHSIPVSGNYEDHNSMGMTSARDAQAVLENTRTILAIELLCAAQAIYLRARRTGEGLQPVIDAIRKFVPPLQADRVVASDINAVRTLVADGSLLAAAEKAVGTLE